jgi:hypothetical protein
VRPRIPACWRPIPTDFVPFPGKTGFVDDQRGGGGVPHFHHVLSQHAEHLSIIPHTLGNELPQRADHTAVDRLGHVLHISSLAPVSTCTILRAGT